MPSHADRAVTKDARSRSRSRERVSPEVRDDDPYMDDAMNSQASRSRDDDPYMDDAMNSQAS
eukprot:4911277-Amphidinium_carterae.1